MSQLNVTLQEIKNFNTKVTSLEFLLKEKKMVKELLKQYDIMFEDNFGKIPTREEKEPLRPIYMYYKKLKQGISAWKDSRKSSVVSRPNILVEQTKGGSNQPQRKSYDAFSKIEPIGNSSQYSHSSSRSSLSHHSQPSKSSKYSQNRGENSLSSKGKENVSLNMQKQQKQQSKPNKVENKEEMRIKQYMKQREEFIKVGIHGRFLHF